MKKSWSDFEDISYKKPATSRKVNFPAGVRSQVNASQDTGEPACASPDPLSATMVACGVRMQSLIIDGIADSLNKDKRRSKENRQATDVEQGWYLKVRLAARDQGITAPLSYPVTVRCECYFGPGERRLDWVNLATTAKLTEDGLVRCGILKNDSPVYVEEGSMKPFRTAGKSYTKFIIKEIIQ